MNSSVQMRAARRPSNENKQTVPEMNFLYSLIEGEVSHKKNLCAILRQVQPEERVLLHRIFERAAVARSSKK